MTAAIDFEAEGLLEGIAGRSREARVQLLEELFAAGVGLEEVRTAVAEGRLQLLPLEWALSGQDRYTPNEVARLSGVDRELLDDQWRALGMAVSDPDEPTQTADELAAAHRMRAYLDAGLEPEAIQETARVMVMAMSQLAAANRQLVGTLVATSSEVEDSAETELDVAHRLEALTARLVPMVGPTLEHIYKLQLRDQIRHAAVGVGEDTVGEEMAVAFADLVGFTKLGETLPPEEFGRITSRFGEMAADVSSGPVRLVKLIGDAAMLASADPAALLGATLDLVEMADTEGEGFPALRAGVSLGYVLPRAGDFYGRSVNLASRITAIARPSSVLVTAELRERLGDRFRFSDAGRRRLKGIELPATVFRARGLDEDQLS